MVRVIICDDQEIVCDGLEAIISTDSELEVVGIAHDGMQAVNLVATHQPDIVLMDLKMPLMNGVQATQQIREQFPLVKVLVLTTYADDEWVFDAIRSGASSYLLKDTPREDLLAAIKNTVAGYTHVDPAVAGKLFTHIAQKLSPPNTQMFDVLSEREREILRMVGMGLNNADIAERLYLSSGTVKNNLSVIFDKLNVSDRTQAAVLAIRYGLVHDEQ